MFEIGDRVTIINLHDAQGKAICGRILSYYYDEGNVWEVLTDGGNRCDCCDDDLIPEKK